MGIFGKLKKGKKPTKKQLSKSIDEFNRLWNMDINEIWNVDDTNAFVIAMVGWINRKCNYGKNIAALTPEEKTVYVVNSFQSEVNNGGFEQFLLNSSGAFFNDLLSSLTAIGADRIAEIYKKALEIFPNDFPTDDERRDAALTELITEEVSETFASCDQKFYENPDDLDELLYQFIVGNKASFA